MAEKSLSFDRVKQNIQKVQRDLPRLLVNDATNYYLKAFAVEGWGGNRWKEVKRRMGPGSAGGGDKGTLEWRYPKNKGLSRRKHKILIGTGRLRQAVANSPKNAKIRYNVGSDLFVITLSVDANIVPYAGYINEGTEHMVKRQFFGGNEELKKILRNRVKEYFDKIW